MESNPYTTLDYLILPLLDENISYADISKESGFIKMYTTDKNYPQTEHCFMLMYDSSVNTKESLARFCKFATLPTIKYTRSIKIEDEHYTVYTFIKNPKYRIHINNILRGNISSSIDYVNRYLDFWKDTPWLPEVVSALMYLSPIPIETRELPEEDYYPDIIEMNDIKLKNQLVV